MRLHLHSKNWIPSHNQGDSQAGRILGGPVLRLILALEAVSAGHPLFQQSRLPAIVKAQGSRFGDIGWDAGRPPVTSPSPG
jgi:hypothetical protein